MKLLFKYRLFCYLVIFFITTDLQSQTVGNTTKAQDYDFINLEVNRLYYFGNNSPLIPFFKNLDSLILFGQGKLNIIHIGGSHIQSGIFPGKIRQQLQTIIPGIKGARGFVFPYRIAQTNSPYDYWVEYSGKWESCRNVEKGKNCIFGLSGISVTTNDTIAEIKIFKRKNVQYLDYDFNKIKIIHGCQDTSYSLEIQNSKVSLQKTIKLDSGYTTFYLDQHLDTLLLTIKKNKIDQSKFTLYGIILENDDPGIIYHSIGINGAQVPSFSECSLLSNHLRLVSPDLIILSLGINDAYGRNFSSKKFILNYDTLINKIKNVNPNIPIILTTNNDSYLYRRYVNKNGAKVRKAMFQIATKHNLAVWDLYAVMGGLNSIIIWQRMGLAKKDKVHFTSKGYNLIGELFSQAFMLSYTSYLQNSTK